MTSTQPQEKTNGHFRVLFSLWPLIVLTPLIPFPSPSVLVGHPWKPELFLSLLLIFVIAALLLKRKNVASTSAIKPISLSIAAFIAWSGVSVLWAASSNSVLHHTLVWVAYLLFVVILSNAITDRRTFRNCIYVLGAVAIIISVNCVIEYVLRDKIDQTFGFRYGRFAEVWAALIPLFFALSIRSNGLKMAGSLMVTALLWLTILFSTSRTSLAAAVGGIAIFVVALLISKKGRTQFKKLAFVVGVLLTAGVVTQLSIFTADKDNKATTFGRIAISSESDASNSVSRNIRFLFISVGGEMLRQNPLLGVGADNFGLEFNTYRAAISEKSENAMLVAGNEDAIPERAHNEYLQVAAELGVIGAVVFATFLIAVVWLGYRSLRESVNIYKLGAAAGIAAFLFSSLLSSFSFRLVQNGVVFFFLVALLIVKRPVKPHNNRIFLIAGLVACICLAILSGLKGASQLITFRGETTDDVAISLEYFSIAERLDEANAAANYLAASKLLGEAHYGEAALQFQAAIDKGVATSATYSYLISTHSLNGDDRAALNCAAAAVKVFPFSPFMLNRYAVLLEKSGNSQEAQIHYAKAKKIDDRQAETWRIFITQGARKAAEAGRNGVGVPLMADLYPQDGLYAMLAERQILYPEERYKFPGQ